MSAGSFFDLLFAGIAVMLVVEGVLPFFSPKAWRSVFERVTRMSDGQIRFLGLASLLSGLVMLVVISL